MTKGVRAHSRMSSFAASFASLSIRPIAWVIASCDACATWMLCSSAASAFFRARALSRLALRAVNSARCRAFAALPRSPARHLRSDGRPRNQRKDAAYWRSRSVLAPFVGARSAPHRRSHRLPPMEPRHHQGPSSDLYQAPDRACSGSASPSSPCPPAVSGQAARRRGCRSRISQRPSRAVPVSRPLSSRCLP